MTNEEKKSLAEELLRQKHKELGRLPRKDDFDEPTRSRIKAFLGPWPRALEAAGLKEPKMITLKTAKRKKSIPKSSKSYFNTSKVGTAKRKTRGKPPSANDQQK